MSVKILRAGLSTSVQDMGRAGYGQYGVPESGVMDIYAAQMANLLVGNGGGEAVLEITLIGPSLFFEEITKVAVCGLGAEMFNNENRITLNEVFQIEANTVLDIRKVTRGNFLYLAVSGGFQTEKVLSSCSMYEGVTRRARLQKGDTLRVPETSAKQTQPGFASLRYNEGLYAEKILPVLPGPEWGMLSEQEQRGLFSRNLTLSPDSNRMAFILKEKMKHNAVSILTAPVLPGTIQLTAGGQLIILMRDGQVTGGYPRILQIDETWLNVLAQKKAGEQLRFAFEKT